MTGRDVLTSAAAMMGDSDCSAYMDVALPALNLAIAECFDANNNLRAQRDKQPLATVPQVKSLDEDLIYEQRILCSALPAGLAVKLYVDDRDSGLLAYLHAVYAEALLLCDRGYARIMRGCVV